MSDGYDLAVSLTEGALNTGFTGLYADPDARTKIFKGSKTITSPFAATVSWDIQAAPTVTIGAPDDQTWTWSVDAAGKHPAQPVPSIPNDLTPVESPPLAKPSVNAFVLFFSAFHAEIATTSGPLLSGTGPVRVVGTATMADGGKASFTAQSIWIDLRNIGTLDQVILTQAILPDVLSKVNGMLQGITLIPPSITVKNVTIGLTAQALTIANGRFTMTAQLASGSGAKTLATMPTDDVVVLMTPELLTQVTNGNIAGTTNSDSGSSLGSNWQYRYTVKSVTVNTSDSGPVTAAVGLTLSAGVDILGGICAASTATSGL